MTEVLKRKVDHMSICLKEDVESKGITAGFEHVHLLHNPMPEIDFEEIDPSTEIFDVKMAFPLMFDALTGGTSESKIVNQTIAEVAKEKGLGMFLGSVRAALEDSSVADTYMIAREKAPDIFLAANIGAPQLSRGFDIDKLKSFVADIKATALVVHLNPLQEVVQVNGEPNFKGVYEKIRSLTKEVHIPIIVKEVGTGFSKEVAVKLEFAGVAAINVSGLGGTNWATVESIRSRRMGDKVKAFLGAAFSNWGVPTVVSLVECAQILKIPVIASGGVRSGIDIAKALVLGAKYCAMALPVLKKAQKSNVALSEFADQILLELKTSMFLTGCRKVSEMRNVRYFVDCPLQCWFHR